jgi:hypothetical protein
MTNRLIKKEIIEIAHTVEKLGRSVEDIRMTQMENILEQEHSLLKIC